MEQPVRVVVVGGGTAGWMVAAACTALAGGACTVRLIESADVGIVGVGEATLPHMRAFLRRLGIPEAAFMQATEATYKLGIQFHDFGRIGEQYFHPFGAHGRPLDEIAFHHFWIRRHREAGGSPIDDYCTGAQAAAACRFAPAAPGEGGEDYGWAYHFDATRFAPFLRAWARDHGARHTEGRVIAVERDGGNVTALRLAGGERVEGDLFIDCTGFAALLIGDTPWEDWSHWLPCDRAVAVPCATPEGPVQPFTRAHAMAAGWRWRIPLRHRIGNGYVYASAFISDDAARAALMNALEGAPLAEPRLLRFRAGRRQRSWVGNVVAVGLASGFLEPLESTSIYLVQAAITQLLEHFPGPVVAPADRDGFNAAVDAEYDRIRDFLILHYHATTRRDSAFWDHVRTMAIPETLAARLELWRGTAQVSRYGFGLFQEPSWVSVLLGQGVVPAGWDPRADRAPGPALDRAMERLRGAIAARVAPMPEHRAALAHIA